MKAYLSYSLDNALRYKASSGGFCKTFLKFALENKIVDKAIITILGDGAEALIPNTIVTNDIEIITSTKSNTIYDKTNPLLVLRKLNPKESYAFVGLPCHILPMKRYCKKKGIKVLTISLFCNHTSNNKYYKSVLDKVGLIESDIKHFEYRGSGWAGYVSIITKDDVEIKVSHHECWSNYSEKYLEMLPKCKKCFRMISEEADICVGDAWLQKIVSTDKKGTCIVVSMNSNADNLIEGCYKKGYICIEQMNNSEFDTHNKAAIKNKINRKNKL